MDLLDIVPAAIGYETKGDPEPWIGVRLPEDAFIDHLEIAADILPGNRRLQRIAVFHEPHGEISCRGRPHRNQSTSHTLDPNERELQKIPIEKSGDLICIRVEATKKSPSVSTRELVRSKIRAMGRPGAERRHPKNPVDVGDVNVPPPYVKLKEPGLGSVFSEGHEHVYEPIPEKLYTHSFPSIAALCAETTKTFRRGVAQTRDSPWPGDARSVACKELHLPVPFTPAPPFVSAAAVETKNGWDKERAVVLQTADGFWLTPLVYFLEHYVESDEREFWLHGGVEEIRVENGQLVVVQDFRLASSSPVEFMVEPVFVRGASWCSGEKPPVCRQWHPSLAPPLAMKAQDGERDVKVVEGLPWANEVSFTVDASGALHRK